MKKSVNFNITRLGLMRNFLQIFSHRVLGSSSSFDVCVSMPLMGFSSLSSIYDAHTRVDSQLKIAENKYTTERELHTQDGDDNVSRVINLSLPFQIIFADMMFTLCVSCSLFSVENMNFV